MDLETLKNDCNELIDELEDLQATGNQLDNRILELQEQLRVLQEQTEPERIKLEWPEPEKEEPELTETKLPEPEQAASGQAEPETVLPEPEKPEVEETEETKEETAVRTEEKEEVEEENLWKEMDKQRFSEGTVIIYEQNPTEKVIVATMKLLALCGILGGIMFCMIYLFANMK